jgi:hypothetical protein
MNPEFLKLSFYYFLYLFVAMAIKVMISSIGAFFHFLLGHDLSSVENWLHQNSWQLFILYRGLAFYLLLGWLRMNLYPKISAFKYMRSENLQGFSLIVTVLFLWIFFVYWGHPSFVSVNQNYTGEHFLSYMGTLVFFAFDLIILHYLADLFNLHQMPNENLLRFSLMLLFIGEFLVSMQDYYQVLPLILFQLIFVFYLAGSGFRNLKSVFLFLILFCCPMSAFFGWDVHHGGEYALFKFNTKISASLLITALLSVGTYLTVTKIKNWVESI